MPKTEKFRFKKLDSIGAADAEEDAIFLQDCFVDTGDLEALSDMACPRRIVVGRTGSGKSALLLRLAATKDRVIAVRPESLALAYISNSTILQFFTELGVKLDIFFKLLWRHVFTVEILKYHFHIENEQDKRSFIERILDLFKDKKHTNALKYLETWGQSFWEETEYRIKELTTKLESELQASLSGSAPSVHLSAGGIQKMSEEQKQEVIQRTQHVVNNVQIRQLSEIMDLLKDVLQDEQKRYFIVIDRLDENWVEDRLRFRLIRALIETVKDFSRVQHVKIVIAVRLDLLETVFRLTRDAGFQEEKYESLYLPLEWGKAKLIELLELRINHLVRSRFTTQPVGWRDILPREVGHQVAIDYMMDRTMMRPRDLILFFNSCIEKAPNRPIITAQIVREAEGEYSRARLRSLADEWLGDYPNLADFARLFRGQKKQFKMGELGDHQCQEFCLEFLTKSQHAKDVLSIDAERLLKDELSAFDFKRTLMQVFYRVGFLGLKLQVAEAFFWTTVGRRSVSLAEVGEETQAAIHPIFWRVLNIEDRR